MSEPSKTPLLDRIHLPSDIKNLSAEQLAQLADELRTETIDAVAKTGGHLGAGLGVVELVRFKDVAALCEKFGRHPRDDAGLVRAGQLQQIGGGHRNLDWTNSAEGCEGDLRKIVDQQET